MSSREEERREMVVVVTDLDPKLNAPPGTRGVRLWHLCRNDFYERRWNAPLPLGVVARAPPLPPVPGYELTEGLYLETPLYLAKVEQQRQQPAFLLLPADADADADAADGVRLRAIPVDVFLSVKSIVRLDMSVRPSQTTSLQKWSQQQQQADAEAATDPPAVIPLVRTLAYEHLGAKRANTSASMKSFTTFLHRVAGLVLSRLDIEFAMTTPLAPAPAPLRIDRINDRFYDASSSPTNIPLPLRHVWSLGVLAAATSEFLSVSRSNDDDHHHPRLVRWSHVTSSPNFPLFVNRFLAGHHGTITVSLAPLTRIRSASARSGKQIVRAARYACPWLYPAVLGSRREQKQTLNPTKKDAGEPITTATATATATPPAVPAPATLQVHDEMAQTVMLITVDTGTKKTRDAAASGLMEKCRRILSDLLMEQDNNVIGDVARPPGDSGGEDRPVVLWSTDLCSRCGYTAQRSTFPKSDFPRHIYRPLMGAAAAADDDWVDEPDERSRLNVKGNRLFKVKQGGGPFCCPFCPK
jgi:hypothetical protein